MATKRGRNTDFSNRNFPNPLENRFKNIEETCVELKRGIVRLERGQEKLLIGQESLIKGQDEIIYRLDGMAGDISEIKDLLKNRG